MPDNKGQGEGDSMLVQATKRKEKIVMGLLSLTCKEETIAQAEDTMNKYRDLEGFEIYLYRVEEEENYVGLLGLEFTKRTYSEAEEHAVSESSSQTDQVSPESLSKHGLHNKELFDGDKSDRLDSSKIDQKTEDLIIVHRISVIPSYEEDAIAMIMLAELEALFPMHTIELSQEVTLSSAVQLDPALWSKMDSQSMDQEEDETKDSQDSSELKHGESTCE